MGASPWHRESCSDGRNYMLAANVYTRYEDEKAIIGQTKGLLPKYLMVETAIRITLDTPLANPEKVTIAIPFEPPSDALLDNIASLMTKSMVGYYLSADPRSTHYGMSNLVMEGNDNSLVRRELEKLLNKFETREDIAGRCLKNIRFVATNAPEKVGENSFFDTVNEGMDIHIGYRLSTVGKNVENKTSFLPISAGKEIIDQVYYNLEQVLHHNFATYDENADGALKITDTLIFKEIAAIINRAKNKTNTRKKLLNNVQFTTVFTEDPKLLYGSLAGDHIYDPLNRVYEETIKEASDRSRELFVSCMLRATEITSASADLSKIGLVEKTVVPGRPEEVSEPAAEPAVKSSAISAGLSLKKDSFEEL